EPRKLEDLGLHCSSASSEQPLHQLGSSPVLLYSSPPPRSSHQPKSGRECGCRFVPPHFRPDFRHPAVTKPEAECHTDLLRSEKPNYPRATDPRRLTPFPDRGYPAD